MYAIIETGGKQYRVSPGAQLKVEKLSGSPGEEVAFERVLLYVPESGTVVADARALAGMRVTARVLDEGRARKVLVFKKKPKNDYKKAFGHRQRYTLVEITGIVPGETG